MLLSRRYLAQACVLALAPAQVLAAPEPAPPTGSPLPGELLVATPDMTDPRFAHTVVLMVQHAREGAFGIAINRPIGDKPVAELLRAIGEDPGDAQATVAVFAGGPVEPSVGFVVHSSEYRVPATLVLDEHLAVSSPRPVLHDIAAGRGPRKCMLTLGYAGWAPRQIEAELSLHAWVTASETPDLIFDMDRAKVWQGAYDRRTISL